MSLLATALAAFAGGAVTFHPAPSPAVSAPAPDTIHLTVADQGVEARYRVREQLARVDFPNDAVGRTSAMHGTLVLLDDGSVDSSGSAFVVDLTGLKSDRDRRDGYVQRRILETETYPEARLVPTAVRGLSLPLPESGSASFELLGDLTVHGVTRPTVWQVEATFSPDAVTGTATTDFDFATFGLQKPSVAIVLSVEDHIALELDFELVRQGG